MQAVSDSEAGLLAVKIVLLVLTAPKRAHHESLLHAKTLYNNSACRQTLSRSPAMGNFVGLLLEVGNLGVA